MQLTSNPITTSINVTSRIKSSLKAISINFKGKLSTNRITQKRSSYKHLIKKTPTIIKNHSKLQKGNPISLILSSPSTSKDTIFTIPMLISLFSFHIQLVFTMIGLQLPNHIASLQHNRTQPITIDMICCRHSLRK